MDIEASKPVGHIPSGLFIICGFDKSSERIDGYLASWVQQVSFRPLMVALAILIVGIFELLPVITEQNQQTQSTFFSIIRDYAIFAFLINLVREMVKDLEDIDGDYNAEIKTLPIVIGRERAGKIVFGVSLIPIAAITFYVVTYLYKQPIAVGYFLLLIIGPLLYFAVKAFNADTKKEWQHLSVILKLVLFFGVLSMMLYKLLLLN